MINGDDYKKLFKSITPSEDLINDIKSNSGSRKKSKNLKLIFTTLAVIVIILSIGIKYILNSSVKSDYSYIQTPPSESSVVLEDGSLFIPPLPLPKNDSDASSNLARLVVYNKRIYQGTDMTYIDPIKAAEIKDRNLGVTKPSLKGWDTQENVSGEFPSTIGVHDVYSIKGYDTDFRILVSMKLSDGSEYPAIFECDNNLTLKTGYDWFGKFKFQNNIKSITYSSFDSWMSYPNTKFIDLNLTPEIYHFIDSLNTSKPISRENSDLNKLFFDGSIDELNIHTKILSITLNDGMTTILRIHDEGYIMSGPGFFQIDKAVMDEVWKNFK